MNKSAVFISYRRDDCAGYAGRLEDSLERILGKGHVFRDIRDIEAGENFAAVIDASLAQARVTLVLIGPRWQGPLANGQRRIDDPQDFVRMEVAAALTSANKVIPVLLASAALPLTSDLPEPLRDLTRRQTLTLNEASWEADLERLVESLDMPTLQARRIRWLAALACFLAVAGAVAAYWYTPATPPVDPAALTTSSMQPLLGAWETTSELNYGWGDRFKETFEFKLFAGQLTGTASYLEYPRGIENLTVNGHYLSFVTHTGISMNNEDRQLTHSYSAELDGNTLRIRMQTTGGFTSAEPIEFAATRAAVTPQ